MTEYKDFQEIAHCGGRIIVKVACDTDGHRQYSETITHDRPVPAAWIGIYALAPHGLPVADFRMGGIGQAFDPQPPEGCYAIFLGSDSHQCWGHQCPRCRGYFRNGMHPAIYPLTCPYCGLRAQSFKFLTAAQRNYIRHYMNTLLDAFEAEIEPGTEREYIIDMDVIADKSGSQQRPDFYYASETQQTRYKCDHCGGFNDIRGRYGYCASCGWRNNAQFLRATFSTLRDKLNAGHSTAVDTVRSAISEFDACCRDVTIQICKRIPMKSGRKIELERLVFHDIESTTVGAIKSMFDIDLLRGLGPDAAFMKMMMHRRHVYEHNTGVADDRYVKESGDQSVRSGALIRETQENAHRLIGGLMRMAENLDADFHEIFSPTEWPIKHHQGRSRTR